MAVSYTLKETIDRALQHGLTEKDIDKEIETLVCKKCKANTFFISFICSSCCSNDNFIPIENENEANA